MAYKNKFCKQGKSKSADGLSMYRPMKFNAGLREAKAKGKITQPEFAAVVKKGCATKKVNPGICPACRKGKKSCSASYCPGKK